MRNGLILAAVSTLAAHDLYLRPDTFQPRPGATLRVEYHNGDAFPASHVPVKLERLRDMQLRHGAGHALPFDNLRIEGVATVADVNVPVGGGAFWLTSRTVPNFIQLEAAQFEEYLKHEGLEEIVRWRHAHGEAAKPGREMYSKYVKALGRAGDGAGFSTQPLGLAIEIVPLADPYALQPGQTLRVQVLWDGKPAAGLAIEMANAYDGKVTKKAAGRTGADGQLEIPLSGAGLWKLHAIGMRRGKNPREADWESFWASLTFELPEPQALPR